MEKAAMMWVDAWDNRGLTKMRELGFEPERELRFVPGGDRPVDGYFVSEKDVPIIGTILTVAGVYCRFEPLLIV